VAKTVLQRLQPVHECQNFDLVEEALLEFDDAAELLQRNAQPVSLCWDLLCKPLAVLSGPTIASFDQPRCNIGDGYQQTSGMLRHRLLAPLARFKPSEKAQRRLGVAGLSRAIFS
jgi:hypothetical protein